MNSSRGASLNLWRLRVSEADIEFIPSSCWDMPTSDETIPDEIDKLGTEFEASRLSASR